MGREKFVLGCEHCAPCLEGACRKWKAAQVEDLPAKRDDDEGDDEGGALVPMSQVREMAREMALEIVGALEDRRELKRGDAARLAREVRAEAEKLVAGVGSEAEVSFGDVLRRCRARAREETGVTDGAMSQSADPERPPGYDGDVFD